MRSSGWNTGGADDVIRNHTLNRCEHRLQATAEDFARQTAVAKPYAILRQLMLDKLFEVAFTLVLLDQHRGKGSIGPFQSPCTLGRRLGLANLDPMDQPGHVQAIDLET